MADMQKRICPHCGGTQFMAYIKRGGIVETNGLDKNGIPLFKIIKEGAKDNFEIEIVKCAKCQTDLTQADLVESGKCKKCGRMVNPTDLNETGVCPVCAVLETNPEINDMSVDDLKFMVAKMMMQNSSVKQDISAKEAKAKMVEDKIAAATQEGTPKEEVVPAAEDTSTPAKEKSGEDVLNDVLNGGKEADPVTEDAKPKRRKMKKGTGSNKDTENASETPQEVTENQTNDAQAQEEIAGSQDAPFPDINDGMMNQPQEEQPIGAGGGFKMFDESEEEQPF